MAAEIRQLEIFVKEALQAGSSRSEIANALKDAGWPAVQVTSALDAFADTAFPVPVPKPRPSLTARDAFLYLLMFSTLYYGAWNLGRLLFSFIDRWLPDPTDSLYHGSFDAPHWSTAAVIIAFPVFFFVANYIGKQISLNPSKRLSPVRRWLTYGTLFIASAILLGDTTALLFSLLKGDSTSRFILKVIVVAAIAGSGFVYYLSDLRTEENA